MLKLLVYFSAQLLQLNKHTFFAPSNLIAYRVNFAVFLENVLILKSPIADGVPSKP